MCLHCKDRAAKETLMVGIPLLVVMVLGYVALIAWGIQ